jgi:hypothetical protein
VHDPNLPKACLFALLRVCRLPRVCPPYKILLSIDLSPAYSVVEESESAWMVQELLYKWLIFFSQSIPHKRPAVLIVDNHESRFPLRIFKIAQSEDMKSVLLPHNATDFLLFMLQLRNLF